MKLLAIAIMLLVARPAWSQNECANTCTTSPEGVALIQFFEGFSPFIYRDSGGLPTIGYGHLVLPHERINEPLLGNAAVDLLKTDLVRTEKGLNSKLKKPVKQNHFDALTSFAFNIGVGACLKSTAFQYSNAGRHTEVPPRMALWVNVNGKPVQGLKVRRAAEGALYAK